MSDDLVFRVADIMRTDLFLVGKSIRGRILGHKFKIGDWETSSDITIIIDENSPSLTSALVRLLGNLWAYIIVTESDNFMLFFDGSHLHLKPGAEAEIGLGNASVTLKKIKNSITRVFHRGSGLSVSWEPQSLEALNTF